MSREKFKESVEHFMAKLKNSEKAPDVDEILIPGERAYREQQKRLKNGIPIDVSAWNEIRKILKVVGLQEKYTF